MVDDDDTDVNPPLSALPPRMRKVWTQLPLAQPETNPPNHSKRTESWRAHERWRSPPETNPESPTASVAEGNVKEYAMKLSSTSGDGEDGDGQETEFDTETEADGLDGELLIEELRLFPHCR